MRGADEALVLNRAGQHRRGQRSPTCSACATASCSRRPRPTARSRASRGAPCSSSRASSRSPRASARSGRFDLFARGGGVPHRQRRGHRARAQPRRRAASAARGRCSGGSARAFDATAAPALGRARSSRLQRARRGCTVRWSEAFIPTLRDDPADAEAVEPPAARARGLRPPADGGRLLAAAARPARVRSKITRDRARGDGRDRRRRSSSCPRCTRPSSGSARAAGS